MMAASAFLVLALASAAPGQETAPAATEADAARHLVFLADQRPIFLRLRITSQGRPFDASWLESVRTIHAALDRNGDGTLTTKEADEKTLAALVRLAAGAAVALPRGELDVDKDGKVSVEELAEALRPILGPFRLQFRRQGVGRTDALFDQLDRDKDGLLSRSELGAIAGSLRPLDLDDDEMIAAHELEPFNSPAFTAMMDESSERESSLRQARPLLKKYDKPSEDSRGRLDNKLSSSEFAIDPAAFAKADRNRDDALDMNELRRFLEAAPVDLTLDLVVPPEASGRATVRAGDGGALPEGAQVRQLADGDVEFTIGQVRLDIHIEPGSTAADDARRVLTQRFKSADVNKDGYIEGKERAALDGPQSPLAGLWEVIDRDHDGKVYLKELLAFGDRQAEAARRRLILTTDDQGRAIFRILDLDRDRRLGAREVMRTVDRVMTWDSDGDSRVSPDEIPYHFLVTIARSGLPGLTGGAAGNPASQTMGAASYAGRAAGPEWFQKMDRNRDGDVSRREFLGLRDQFDRLDRDKDGLIDADEAGAGTPAKTK
jgi:Ca2+-binding EF-hand superfamily protein